MIFVSLKSAITPRPASWILERSLDGNDYYPWQYFGASDADCQSRYNLRGQSEPYQFQSDSEVICSTKFARAIPLENGEVRKNENSHINCHASLFGVFSPDGVTCMRCELNLSSLGCAHDKRTRIKLQFVEPISLNRSSLQLDYFRSICRWSKIDRRQKPITHRPNCWILRWHVLCACDSKACTPHHIQVIAFNG